MVDTFELFQKLSKGASFKNDDANSGQRSSKPKLTEEQLREKQRRMRNALDFFREDEQPSSSLNPGKRRTTWDKELPNNKKRKITGEGEEDADDAERHEGSENNDEQQESNSECGEEGIGDQPGEKVTCKDKRTKEALDGIRLFSSDDKPILTNNTNNRHDKKKKKTRSNLTALELKKREANEVRFLYRIYVSGDDVPDAITSFDDLKKRVPSYILRNLTNMRYKEPTPIQMQALPLLLEGREILACAPTGSGKTAAFAIPILTQLKGPQKDGFRAIVVCPTRELALQTQREFCRLCKGSGYCVDALTGQRSSAVKFGPNSSHRSDILVTTPIRLIRMLSSEPPSISVQNVEWLILDESDKLFEDGIKGFKKQIAEIYSACDNPGIKHALFSATLTTGVEEFCRVHLDSFVKVTIGKVNTTADVKQQLLFVGQETGKLLAVRDIIHKGFTPPVLIFVQSVDRAKQLFHELIYDGMNVDVIHSERTQAQRDNIIKSFRAGKIWILICTDLMGRGIDFKGVNMVINYDFPPNAISYIHRIGRTGRAGRKGEAVTFFTESDVVSLRSIASVMRNSGCEVPEWMLQLKKISKTARKTFAKKPVNRKDIKTASKYDLDKAKKRRVMIAASQKRKRKQKMRQARQQLSKHQLDQNDTNKSLVNN